MATSMRFAIAHAFTPWDWKSRRSIVALVGLTAVVMVAGALLVLASDARASAKVFNIVMGELLAYFVSLRPAIRSVLSWDERHAKADLSAD